MAGNINFGVVPQAIGKDHPEGALAGVLRVLEESPRAVSMVIGPTGEPVSDVLAADEGLLYATIDTRACVEPKQFHDVVGYYNPFDVFRLTVDRTRQRPVTWRAEAAPPPRAAEVDEPPGISD